MWGAILQAINPFGIVEGILENRRHKRDIKGAIKEQQLKNIQQGKISEAEWNLQSAKNAASSWKDEWLLVLFSIPMVGAFIPWAEPHIMRGFEVLEQMPMWYQGAFAVAVAASYGYQKYAKTRFNNAYSLPEKK